jgi:transketolase
MERFERLSPSEKEDILPFSCKNRIAIEAAHPQPWYRYVGLEGHVVGVDAFGFSASADDLREYFEIKTSRLEAIFLKTI